MESLHRSPAVCRTRSLQLIAKSWAIRTSCTQGTCMVQGEKGEIISQQRTCWSTSWKVAHQHAWLRQFLDFCYSSLNTIATSPYDQYRVLALLYEVSLTNDRTINYVHNTPAVCHPCLNQCIVLLSLKCTANLIVIIMSPTITGVWCATGGYVVAILFQYWGSVWPLTWTFPGSTYHWCHGINLLSRIFSPCTRRLGTRSGY